MVVARGAVRILEGGSAEQRVAEGVLRGVFVPRPFEVLLPLPLDTRLELCGALVPELFVVG